MSEKQSLADALETSIAAAIEAGRIDARAQAAPIEAARKLAESIDADCEKSANVKFPVMLKYMEALGMIPEIKEEEQKPQASRLMILTNKTKFAKASND